MAHRNHPPDHWSAHWSARRRGYTFATLTLSVCLLAAGCSSDAKKAVDTTTPATVELATTTTAKPKPTTTTSAADDSSTSSSVEETTTTLAPVPTYPLTGLPQLDPAATTRPALVVKIDNHPLARPQTGINEADLVYEENVEHQTRFAAVFQSNGADPVGPIRSGRTQDVALLGSLNKPLFAWSGGNGRVTAAILASDLVQINETNAGKAMFRDHRRGSPHNLYGTVTALYGFTPPDASAPVPQFQYRPAGVDAAGDPTDAVKVSMDGINVLWQWDPATSTYLRFSDGKVHKDALTDQQLATSNVVVLFLDYRPSPADENSPEAQTIGTGEVWVFSSGKLVKGTWTRIDRLLPFTLTDAAGAPILVTPGHTFVELSRVNTAAAVPAGTDINSVKYP